MGRMIVGAAVLVLVTACGSPAGTGDGGTLATSAVAGTPPTVTAAPQPVTPEYSVVGEADTRADGKSVYFVVVDPVDLRSDSFKQDVRLVLQAVEETDRGPHFSARVFDDRAIAVEALARETDLQESQSEHLVAMYVGGLTDGLGYPYYLSWYPGATMSTPIVGPHAGSEQWTPAAV